MWRRAWARKAWLPKHGEKTMTAQSSGMRGTSGSVVVGYFADGGDAYRAINDLIDEGFSASDMGAAFRTRRAGQRESAAVGEMRNINELTKTNPAVSGSVGGPASGDEAVTPAGLAPGSGNSFPGAPSTPGPIPGSEVPSTLPHDLPETLPHDLPSTLRHTGAAEGGWVEHLHGTYERGQQQHSGDGPKPQHRAGFGTEKRVGSEIRNRRRDAGSVPGLRVLRDGV